MGDEAVQLGVSELELGGFRCSAQIDKIAAAIAKAQLGLTQPKKGKTATIEGKNGKSGFGYSYADLNDVVEATNPYAANGIAILQSSRLGENRETVVVTTLLAHESGQYIESLGLDIPIFDKATLVGSACTFGRRYDLSGMTKIAGDQDDDAQSLRGETKAPTAKGTPPKPKPTPKPEPDPIPPPDEPPPPAAKAKPEPPLPPDADLNTVFDGMNRKHKEWLHEKFKAAVDKVPRERWQTVYDYMSINPTALGEFEKVVAYLENNDNEAEDPHVF